MTITKAEMVKIICEKMGFEPKESAEIVEHLFEIMKETLVGGEKIKITGFGNFNLRTKGPRKGRNPKTCETIVISGRRVVAFKPSALLRKSLNQEVSQSEISGASQEGSQESEDP